MKESNSAAPLLRHLLEPGNYGCGFTNFWRFDYGRTYDRVFEDGSHSAQGKSPRPILINLWYPLHADASHSPLLYGEYLNILSEDRRLSDRLRMELAAYARSALI